MGNIILKHELKFKLIPEILADEFSSFVMEAYVNGWHDLHNLTDHTDSFSLYSRSFQETGDPFKFSDDESREQDNRLIMERDFTYLMEDVAALLNHHHMFYAWMDKAKYGDYKLIGCVNMPFKEIW